LLTLLCCAGVVLASSRKISGQTRPALLHSGHTFAIAPPPATIANVVSSRLVEMEVTAYCACRDCCGHNARGITASGRHVSYNDGRFVAADTSLLPFGTRLSIPGYHGGEAVEVIDRGSAIKGNKLDVFFPDHETARHWGRQTVWVEVFP
jgi:3D (Asp-Asp-Asp) domain-containing protein